MAIVNKIDGFKIQLSVTFLPLQAEETFGSINI
jgi:hypothetical protein